MSLSVDIGVEAVKLAAQSDKDLMLSLDKDFADISLSGIEVLDIAGEVAKTLGGMAEDTTLSENTKLLKIQDASMLSHTVAALCQYLARMGRDLDEFTLLQLIQNAISISQYAASMLKVIGWNVKDVSEVTLENENYV